MYMRACMRAHMCVRACALIYACKLYQHNTAKKYKLTVVRCERPYLFDQIITVRLTELSTFSINTCPRHQRLDASRHSVCQGLEQPAHATANYNQICKAGSYQPSASTPPHNQVTSDEPFVTQGKVKEVLQAHGNIKL